MAFEWRKSPPTPDKDSNPKKEPLGAKDVDVEIAAMREKFAARRAAMNEGHNKRIEELRVAGESARTKAMQDFDIAAAERAAKGQVRVDAANKKLADSVEKAKRRFPDRFN